MYQFILKNLPWFWLVLCIVLAIIEGLTLGLTTIWFAIGALVMVFVSMTGLPFLYQMLIFVLVSAALLFFTRPVALKKMNIKRVKTNADSIVGKKVIVTKAITRFEMGEVKVHGVVWSAVAENEAEIAVGTECTVKRIEGVRLIISPLG